MTPATKTAATMLAGLVTTSSLRRDAPPVRPMNGATMESARTRARNRPVTTGAIKMMPQVRYQGCTTGPSRTKASAVTPSAVSRPSLSLFSRQ